MQESINIKKKRKPSSAMGSSLVRVLSDFFARIWAVWALLLFIATLVIVFFFYIPCFFLQDPKKAIWHRKVSRIWMFVYLPLIGCPLKVMGKDNFKKDRNYIVVCNHNSFMDVPVSTPFMPRPNKTIGKKEFTKTPIFGWIYGFGSVLVDRKSDASRRKSYDDMKRMLAIGLDMVIYPEGTRNRTNDPLKPFYGGAFRLAKDTKKEILPAVLFHTKKVLPAHKGFYILPHSLEMHFLPAISSDNISADELQETVFKIMWDYYLLHDY
jgi:1-acyl-sn-glycerol-3-phosphate acyltransferase